MHPEGMGQATGRSMSVRRCCSAGRSAFNSSRGMGARVRPIGFGFRCAIKMRDAGTAYSLTRAVELC